MKDESRTWKVFLLLQELFVFSYSFRLSATSLQPYVFVGVAQPSKVTLEILESDDHSSPTVVGVKGKRLLLRIPVAAVIPKRGVEEEVDVMLLVVNESEGRDATGFEPKIPHHALRRSEGKLAARRLALCLKCLLQPCFEVVNVEVVVAMEADEVVLVALMVAHEDVLAMDRAVVLPPAFRLLDGLAFGMAVAGEGYVVFLEVIKNYFLSFSYHVAFVL